MSAIGNVKIELEKRLEDRQRHKLSMEPFKEEIEKLIEWLFNLLDRLK